MMRVHIASLEGSEAGDRLTARVDIGLGGLDHVRFKSPSHPLAHLTRCYMLKAMSHELDDIRAQTDCPNCGEVLSVSYRTLRLGRTIECRGCGETIRLEDDTPLSKVQTLIDEASRRSKDS